MISQYSNMGDFVSTVFANVSKMVLDCLKISQNKSSELVFASRNWFEAENHVILHLSSEKLWKFWDIWNNFLCVTIWMFLFKRDKLGKEWAEKVRRHTEKIKKCVCFDFSAH